METILLRCLKVIRQEIKYPKAINVTIRPPVETAREEAESRCLARATPKMEKKAQMPSAAHKRVFRVQVQCLAMRAGPTRKARTRRTPMARMETTSVSEVSAIWR